MIFAHPFSNIVVTRVLKPLWKRGLSKKQEVAVWATAIVSTVFPDVDLVYALVTGENHRFLITHTFVPYAIFAVLVIVLSYIFAKKLKETRKDFLEPAFIRLLVPMMLIGVAIHLATDTLGAPVRLLYPFSNKEFMLIPINSFLNGSNLPKILQYYTTPFILAFELFWIGTGTIILYRMIDSNIYLRKYLPKTLGFIVACAATMLTVVLIV
ncbi:metal-dependent hydrolase [Candidatus Dojkabacteria bacterium]|nr:metal-dependent hydrolase [Candidatus Dojkabacteria bacterium]